MSWRYVAHHRCLTTSLDRWRSRRGGGASGVLPSSRHLAVSRASRRPSSPAGLPRKPGALRSVVRNVGKELRDRDGYSHLPLGGSQ
jgi:hypothetical protein